jgi:exodeoxyribonuclease VII large subunit
LKDGTGESMLPCFIWRNEYDLSAVPLAEGLEIIVTGHAEVYKPAGRLSFRTRLIELVGEGALKHAYDELARRLEGEGVFSLDTKRELPQYPEHIGLITSRDGAVISDFLTNLDRFGFHISFTHTSVEGKAALTEILAAFHRMESLNIDVIVLIRGGGSLESLQAFNAEPVIRAIKRSKVPVIAGIGHDQDVPLASRAADALVSTPTAAAHLVGQSWREARERLTRAESRIVLNMGSAIARVRQRVASHTEALGNQVDQLALVRRASLVRILRCVAKYENELQAMGHRLKQLAQSLIMGSDSLGRNLQVRVDEVERMLRVLDPRRVLGLGYSIVRSSRGVVRKMKDIREGDVLSFEVTDGTVSGTMNSISHHKKKSHEQKN